jgi:hypothetical protein
MRRAGRIEPIVGLVTAIWSFMLFFIKERAVRAFDGKQPQRLKKTAELVEMLFGRYDYRAGRASIPLPSIDRLPD